ncbi:hypothetical protein [Ectothiorhodospira sp. BSL-9]|uniref:hypothetical protein n=1 Tax=Ectothiorhodospira sp. BSL-9 TaxID=1442136 RepID=UPI0012E9281D|nr:hypothetical protein [Ectothiorhodospira sp. BSL-9]
MLVGTPSMHLETEPFPTQPRKVKRWLRELPLANTGETTRLFYQGLTEFNRLRMPPDDRLEILELLRPTRKVIVDQLSRHFINRSLPLASRSQRIANINTDLLHEFAMGYLQVVREGSCEANRLAPRHLGLAIHRAMRALAERQFHAGRLYQPTPDGLWEQAHWLYHLAEQRQLVTKEIKDVELNSHRRSTVAHTYKQISLYSLADPLTLHQGDADALARYLEDSAHECAITTSPVADNADHLYVLDLSTDEPPAYIHGSEVSRHEAVRYLNLFPLIRQIREEVRAGSQGALGPLHKETAARILQAWTNNARRRFSRISRDGRIDVVLGISAIHEMIRQAISPAPQASAVGKDQERDRAFEELTLERMSDSPRYESEGITVRYLADTPKDVSSSAWDTIAKGNLVTDRTTQDQSGALQPREEAPAPTPWEVLDTSAGGFRLRWRGDMSVRAQVGELIALRDANSGREHWRPGMIRWIRSPSDAGLEVGIKMLAPKAMPVDISPVRHGRPMGRSIPGLLLPRIKVLEQQATLICRAGLFEAGERVAVTLAGRTLMVDLSAIETQSSLFTQFQFRPAQFTSAPEGETSDKNTPPWPDIL